MKSIKHTWLITGAASGIGRELANQLARRGERLVLWDRDAENLERATSLLGPAVRHSHVVDIVSSEASREAAQRSVDVAGPITRVVHCAGILRVGSALTMSATDYRAMMKVNFLGTVHVARALVPVLIDAGKRVGGGSKLVFISSIAGLRGIPTLAGYSASKYAVVGFAQALRDELYDEPLDIRVVCPPPVDTPMVNNLPEVPAVYRLSPPQPVELVAGRLLDSLDRSDWIATLDAPTTILWRMQRAIPSGLDWALRRASRR